MLPHSQEFYHAAIKVAYPDACDIRHPALTGMTAPVFLADVNTTTRVFKFNFAPLVFKNKIASNLLQEYDIPVPCTKIHAYLDTWFESYEYCPLKTLQEHINAGIDDKTIFNAYTKTIEIQNKIANISPREFVTHKLRYYHDILGLFAKRRPFPINLYQKSLNAMSRMGKMKILHNDIHPGNILYSPDNNTVRLIDLDAVALCNENFTMMTTLQRYPLNDIDALMGAYRKICGRRLDDNAIKFMLNVTAKIHNTRVKLEDCYKRILK